MDDVSSLASAVIVMSLMIKGVAHLNSDSLIRGHILWSRQYTPASGLVILTVGLVESILNDVVWEDSVLPMLSSDQYSIVWVPSDRVIGEVYVVCVPVLSL